MNELGVFVVGPNSLGRRSPAADLLSALNHKSVRRCKRGEHREKLYWICTEQIFKGQFFSNEVTIFTLTFRFKAQQCNHHNLKVLYDLTKNVKSCTKFNGGLSLCMALRQREVNQNSQIDQSQAGIDVNRRQADQANGGPFCAIP